MSTSELASILEDAERLAVLYLQKNPKMQVSGHVVDVKAAFIAGYVSSASTYSTKAKTRA